MIRIYYRTWKLCSPALLPWIFCFYQEGFLLVEIPVLVVPDRSLISWFFVVIFLPF